MSIELVGPGAVVIATTVTKREANTWGGFSLECMINFTNGKKIIYMIESDNELFLDKYSCGTYEWKDDKFTQI